MKEKIKKNHKLVIQVGKISILILIVSLIFSVLYFLFLSQDIYLTSKNEMIDKDIAAVNRDFVWIPRYEWFLSYQKKNSYKIIEYVENQEINLYTSAEYTALYEKFLYEKDFKPEQQTPEVQLFLAVQVYKTINSVLESSDAELLKYDRRYLLILNDEHKSYLVEEIGDEDIKSSVGHDISYEASEHSAIRDILSGKLKTPEQTIYEKYTDEANNKSYYIGYTVINSGNTESILCLWYDWSDFRKRIIVHIILEIIIGSVVLLVLNSLLMMYIYRIAINPVIKVENGIRKYRKNKDSSLVAEAMNKIKVKNEIGVLADSFSELAGEIERYNAENLKLCSEKERIAAELDLATKIQANMLPNIFPAFPERSEFDIYASMTPAKEVSGDFYDFFLIDKDHLCLVVADVSGKGVPSALFMMASKIMLADYAKMGKTPSEILTIANNAICENNKENMFITVWLGILEISTGKLTAANAGHEYPSVSYPGNAFELYKDKHDLVLGCVAGLKFGEYSLYLKPETRLFLYTDGLTEANNSENSLFGTEKMLEALNENKECTPKQLLENVRRNVDGFVNGAEQFDDLTMLCFEYKGKEAMEKTVKDSLTLEADIHNLPELLSFIGRYVQNMEYNHEKKKQLDISVEEIFVNIASYAYPSGSGKVTVSAEYTADTSEITVTFIDDGIPYNPVSSKDPDITLYADKRQIGGLGIFMVKNMMDKLSYEYKCGQNIFKITKKLS